MKLKIKLLTIMAATALATCLSTNGSLTYAAKKPSGQITLGITSYVYNKNGERVSTKKAVEILDTNQKNVAVKKYNQNIQIKYGKTLNYYGKPRLVKTSLSTFGYPTSKKDTKAYYNIGNGYYINTKNTTVPTGKTTLTVYRKSKIYNNKGKITKKKPLKANMTVYSPSRPELISGKKNYYSLYYKHIQKYNWYYLKQRFWVPYTKINGKLFYNLGKGKYIRASNVSYLAGKEVFVPKKTTVTLLKKTTVTPLNSYIKLRTLKKGTKVKVDFKTGQETSYPDDYHETRGIPVIKYHILGTKDEWIPGDVDEAKAYQKLERNNVENQIYMHVKLAKEAPLQVYNYQGKGKDAYLSPNSGAYSVNGAVYLWNSEEKKAELYYHLADIETSASNKEGKGYGNFYVGDALVKAADVKYINGVKFKPINTPEEAKSGENLATKSERAALTKLINDQSKVKESNKYKLSDVRISKKYDLAIEIAQGAMKEKNLSQTSVKYLQWLITSTQKQLNG